MSIIVTGASGHLGRRTAELLIDQVDPGEAVLVTRTPEALADLAERGVTVRHGDFDEPASLESAFAGGTRLLLISTDAVGRRVAQHGNAIDAALAAGVELVAYTSIPNPSDHNPALVVADHRGTEERLRASGLQWTFLRNALYSEYRIPEAQAAIASGTFHHNQGDGRSAYVSREDCAAAAVAVLTGGHEHAGQAYDITGPELLGGEDLARLYSAAGGADVSTTSLDDPTFSSGLEAAGLPPGVSALVTSFGAAIRKDQLGQCSDAVEALTGRAPISVETVLERALTAAH